MGLNEAISFRPLWQSCHAAGCGPGNRQKSRREKCDAISNLREEKIRIVEASLRGHHQGSATARRYGLSRSLISIWRRQYRRGKLGAFQAADFVAVSLHDWLLAERAKLSSHNKVAKAINYMFEKEGRWEAFTRSLDDGRLCLSNNAAE